MQTVPSLVGTGTAIAAAATGLVFGQPTEPEPHTTRPSTREKISYGQQSLTTEQALSTLPVSRPGTSSGTPPPRPLSSQFTSSNAPGSRHSFVRQGDGIPAGVADGNRDSISSSSSWIRRLSIRPLSQHGSPRSSVGPDSPSITFSHGSSAPILSPTGSAAPPLPPNKLVKRTASTRDYEDASVSRPRSRAHLPTLRRPATSHQRSATLQQLQPQFNLLTPVDTSTPSFGRHFQPQSPLHLRTTESPSRTKEKSGWTSFFHSRTTDSNGRSASSRLGDFGSQVRNFGTRRIQAAGDGNCSASAHLVKPRMVSGASSASFQAPPEDIQEEADPLPEELDYADSSPDLTPAKRAKRSFSMTFSSAGNWVSRTSGSLRRPKRGGDSRMGNKRTVSEPLSSLQPTADQGISNASVNPMHPEVSTGMQGSALDSATNFQSAPRKRNSSSPLPPLPRLSTFHVDLSRLGSSGGVTNHVTRPYQASGSSTSSTIMSQFRASLNDRPPPTTSDNLDADTRGFTSGDDDDTDFKSDTMFDSLRTVASGRVRAVETPLESVYDESPPSTAGNSKTKRLSIQEILGKGWDEDNRIMEEDESLPTPIIASFRAGNTDPSHAMYTRFSLDTDTNESLPTGRDFGRLSMDDDFDDDWARDDEVPYNALSPPSKGSSVNSRGINPNVRLALANISGNSLPEPNRPEISSDRPLSHLFDWSEPSTLEKQDVAGRSPRPKTSYAKQGTDPRGGRSTLRKGPTPTHVRSQSVPVVHDPSEETNKPTGAKYGTWGMATKTVSEDWDDDFEFGGSTAGHDGKGGSDLFAVPEAIRATQPSVKAHSGQIRELSLLVNDLKRLCRHARDMDILNGPQKGLWKEAEGIIALASPDEDSMDGDNESSSSFGSDDFDVSDHLDDSFDSTSIDKLDAAFDGREPIMSKTAVVRERHSSRRRSVFSPDDDIFGGGSAVADDGPHTDRPSRPRTPDTRYQKSQDVTSIMRSVMETMHQNAATEAQSNSRHTNNRVHFDTNSLKALVKRAGDLRDALSDMVRRADQITQSPVRTPRHERHVDSSPAFTRVFDEPGSSPPRRAARSRGATPMVDSASPENSPSSTMARRMQMMTVN
ncbi:hypothetical protein HJFPF1_09012 [Paramyrothecium foliicola]|nr:hypothetical protein HJFPF1_09012 [Paramyrothecium foliicola]